MSDNNNGNTVTNVTENYFRTLTTTTVKIEAVNPAKTGSKTQVKEEPKAQPKEEPKAQGKESPEPKVKEDPKATTKSNEDHSKKIPDWLWIILLVGAIAALLIWLYTARLPAVVPAAPAGSANEPVATSSAPISPSSDGASLESPDQRSATSNENFIGYFGNREQNWIVPVQVLDTSNQTRDVGSVLFTWANNRFDCYFTILHPGDTIVASHPGGQVNVYASAYSDRVTNELQYIGPDCQKWTAE